MVRYFEDLTVGEVSEGGEYLVTEEEIVSFAQQYDPQAFHLDKKAAEASPFGGLVASGWHTAAIGMRLSLGLQIEEGAFVGSPGVDELRWLAPVRPQDVLSARLELLDLRPSQSKPQIGSAFFQLSLKNQEGVEVMRAKTIGLIRRRPQDS